jgi:hypothetical protein
LPTDRHRSSAVELGILSHKRITPVAAFLSKLNMMALDDGARPKTASSKAAVRNLDERRCRKKVAGEDNRVGVNGDETN